MSDGDAFPTRCDDPRLLEGLRLLCARRWYDAHEALEGPWGELEPGPWREVLQALIQHCVALEHLRRDNALGAFNVWSRARGKLKGAPEWVAGIGVGPWGAALERFYAEADLATRVQTQLEGGVAAEGLGPREGRAALADLPAAETWPVPPLDDALRAALEAQP